jgi:hypothetical protein
MVQAKHITAAAVGLIAACLSGCGYATLDSDTTASLNSSASSPIRRATPSASISPSTTSDKTSAAALNSTTESAAASTIADDKVIEPHGRAYLFRGVAGLIYSRGMDQLAYRIDRQQLATKIAELAATPADVGEAVPLRLDVPATAAAELWDSGLPVAAHERDTLETLAASYHVPLCAVAQVNPVAKNASLTEGQRIIVPRHLAPVTPPSPVSSYAPSEH